MKITVLGNNGPFPGAGGACSGYLLQGDGKNVLIDCGNGVLANLQRYIGLLDLDAIVLTHLHSDHISDMMVLRYAIQIKKARGQTDKVIDAYAPQEPADEYARLDIKGVFNIVPVSENLELQIGNLKFDFKGMRHPYKCFAVSVQEVGKRFVFSGDTSWTENIIDFSRNADLLMLDAGLLSEDKKSDDVPHLTARECGIVARDAGAKKLLLTHFWPEYDKQKLLSEALESFEDVQIAEMFCTYKV